VEVRFITGRILGRLNNTVTLEDGGFYPLIFPISVKSMTIFPIKLKI